MHTTHRRRASAPPRKQEGRGRHSSRAQRNHPLSALGSPRPQRNSPTPRPPAPLPNPHPRARPPTSLPPAECLQPSPHTLVKQQVWGSSQAPPGTPIPASRPLIKLSSTLPAAPDVASPALHCNPITCLLQSLQEPPRECGIQAQIFNLLLKALQI